MAAPRETESQVSFPLDLGVDNTAMGAAVQPFGEAPVLVRSENTRLSRTRGMPRKAPGGAAITGGDVGAGVVCGGIVPAGHVDSSIAFFHPLAGGDVVGNQRVVGTQAAAMRGTVRADAPTYYYPAQVTRAGVLPGGSTWRNVAIAYHEGKTWTVTVREQGASDFAYYLSCFNDDGEQLVPPYPFATIANATAATTAWAGLTEHGANGVVLWYRDVGDAGSPSNAIKARFVSVSGLALTLGTATTIYTPVYAVRGERFISVHSDDDSYAYLATVHSATNTTLAVHKVAIPALTVSTTTKTSYITLDAGNPENSLHVQHYKDASANYVLVCVGGNQNANGKAVLFDGGTMIMQWEDTAIGTSSLSMCGSFHVGAGVYYAVVAVKEVGAAFSSMGDNGTVFRFYNIINGALLGSVVVPWKLCFGSPQMVRPSADESYCVFPMQHNLHASTPAATDEGYVFDTSVELYKPEVLPDFTLAATAVGRFGVNSAYRHRLDTTNNGTCANGSAFVLTYLQDSDTAVQDGYHARYVEVDFGTGQPRYAHTPDGAAIIAAAMPAQWDGSEVTELLPLHAPAIHVQTTGGSGPTLTSGTYRISAVRQWRDATGVVHRSEPAVVREISGAALEPIIWVTREYLARDNIRQEGTDVIVYISDKDKTVLYAQGEGYVSGLTVTDYWLKYDTVAQPEVDETHPPIYSDGDATQELIAQCPGALRDVAIVGSRAWALPAERPNEAWPSKQLDPVLSPDTAFEWNVDLRVMFPASAGSLLAVRELNGFPTFFSSSGVWAVTGAGPDNTLQGQPFNSPEQLAVIECSDASSVVSTPAGVLFRSHNRFVLFNGEARQFDQVDASAMGAIVTAFVDRKASEAVFVGESGAHCVYNYAIDRWTTWDDDTIGAVTAAALVPSSGKLLTYDETAGEIVSVDLEGVSTAAQLAWESGDILLGGPQDDNVLREVLVHALSGGAHGLTVTVTLDYGTSDAIERVWSASEVTANTVNGQYTLAVDVNRSARAVKVVVQETDAAGDGCKPISVTLKYAKQPGTSATSIYATGRK